MHTPTSPAPLTRLATFIGAFGRGLAAGVLLGTLGGTIFGTIVVPLFGTIAGFQIGFVVGLVVGIVNAFAVGLLLAFVFYPLYDRKACERSIRFVSVVLTLIVSLIAFAVVRGATADTLFALIFTPDLYVVVPALLAALIAWHAATRYLQWYLQRAPQNLDDRSHHRLQRWALPILAAIVLPYPIGWCVQQWPTLYFRGPPGQDLIVYVQRRYVTSSYLSYVTPDSTIQGRLTYHFDPSYFNSGVVTLRPQIAPNGAGIVYLSNHAGANYELYQLRLDGSTPRFFDSWTDLWRDSALAPDGQKLVKFERWMTTSLAEQREDVRVYVRGRREPICLTCTFPRSWGQDFSWSPDSQRLAFSLQVTGQQHVFAASWDGSNLTALTSEADVTDSDPAWSPDGQWIAFTRTRAKRSFIMVMRRDGSDIQQLTVTGSDREPTWSPDGTQIAFVSQRDRADPSVTRNSDIYTMQRDGGQQRRVTSGDGEYASPVWVRVPAR